MISKLSAKFDRYGLYWYTQRVPKCVNLKKIRLAQKYMTQGLSKPKAMIKAGFSYNYALRPSPKYPAHQILSKFALDYRLGFTRRIMQKCPPEAQADVLVSMITSTSKKTRDFDKIQAIRTAHLVICKSGEAAITNISPTQNFVILPTINQKTWENVIDVGTPKK